MSAPNELSGPRVTEFTPTAFRVFDLARSLAFYVDGCGLFRLHDIAAGTFDGVIVGQQDGSGGGIELMRERDSSGHRRHFVRGSRSSFYRSMMSRPRPEQPHSASATW